MQKLISFLAPVVFSLLVICGDVWADHLIRRDTVSVIYPLFVQHETTSNGLANLAHDTGGLNCHYKRDTATAEPVQIPLVSGTRGVYASGSFVAVDNSLMPGSYELGIPNAAFVTGANFVALTCKGAANMRTTNVLFRLVNFDLNVATQNVVVQTNNDKGGYSLAPSQSFSTTGSIGSVLDGVTVSVNLDKDGYTLDGTVESFDELVSVLPSQVWAYPIPSSPTDNSAGQFLSRAYHYTAGSMEIDNKSKRFVIYRDNGQVFERGTTSISERKPDR